MKRLVYKPSDLVVGAKDAEDAIRRFKEDQSRFVRPVVCCFLFPLLLYLGLLTRYVTRLLIGLVEGLLLGIMSRRF